MVDGLHHSHVSALQRALGTDDDHGHLGLVGHFDARQGVDQGLQVSPLPIDLGGGLEGGELAGKAGGFRIFRGGRVFVLPLIAVFVLSYLGTTSEQLGQFVNRHTASIKLLTALVFVGLALWMTWTMAPLFGIVAPWDWLLMAGVVIAILAAAALLQMRSKPAARPTARRRRSRV